MKTANAILVSLILATGTVYAQGGVTDMTADAVKINTIDGVGDPIHITQYLNARFDIPDRISVKADIATRLSMGLDDSQDQSLNLEDAVITTTNNTTMKFPKGRLLVTPDGNVQLTAKIIEVQGADSDKDTLQKPKSLGIGGFGAPFTAAIEQLPPRGSYVVTCTVTHLNINNVTYGAGEHVCIGEDEWHCNVHGEAKVMYKSSACN